MELSHPRICPSHRAVTAIKSLVSGPEPVFRPSTYWLKERLGPQKEGSCNTVASIYGNDSSGQITKMDLSDPLSYKVKQAQSQFFVSGSPKNRHEQSKQVLVSPMDRWPRPLCHPLLLHQDLSLSSHPVCMGALLVTFWQRMKMLELGFRMGGSVFGYKWKLERY